MAAEARGLQNDRHLYQQQHRDKGDEPRHRTQTLRRLGKQPRHVKETTEQQHLNQNRARGDDDRADQRQRREYAVGLEQIPNGAQRM